MAAVVACGPVASGTRLIYHLIEHWFKAEQDEREVVHWSMPNWQTFWSWDEWPDDTKFVIVTRRPDVSTLSAWEGGHGRTVHERVSFREWRATAPLRPDEVSHADMKEWWDRAMELLADFPIDRSYWVSYEALCLSPHNQARGIARFLGFDRDDMPTPIRDQNKKWLMKIDAD